MAPRDLRIDFTIAAVRPGLGDLDSRRSFDAAILTSRTLDGHSAVVGVHDDRIARFDDAGLERTTPNIIGILTQLADDPDSFKPPLSSDKPTALLRSLALQGVQLYKSVGQSIEAQLHGDDLTRIQVLTSDANEFVPIEFIYDLPPPSFDARLCPNWQSALVSGKCEAKNHPAIPGDLSSVVCPLGFWALSKVIERQVVGIGNSLSELGSGRVGVRSEPSSQRPHLAGVNGALLGVSSKVDSVRAGSADVFAALKTVTRQRAWQATSWLAWEQGVTKWKPGLLVLIAHTESIQSTAALEIGTADYKAVAHINASLVQGEPGSSPMILLLGCDTAVANRDLQSFVGAFRDSGAALVVGTIAAILGENAAPMAQALIGAIADAAERTTARSTICFGDVMLNIRRQLLGNGELMALCLTSYGDADWQLAASA